MPPCLDEGEVEAGRVGDRLQVVGIADVAVVAGNRRMLADGERRDGLRQLVAEVGVEPVAAVARPEAGVDAQLHQVGQPADVLLSAVRLAARQLPEPVEVNRLLAVRLQVGVDEGDVAELVVGVVVDVLVHVPIQHLHGGGIGGVPGAARHLAVLDAGELVVLLPQIRLDDLGGSQELEDRGVSLGEAAAMDPGMALLRKDI